METKTKRRNYTDVEDAWILDSGSTHYVCKRRKSFSTFQEIDRQKINTATDSNKPGAMLKVKGTDEIHITTLVDNYSIDCSLSTHTLNDGEY